MDKQKLVEHGITFVPATESEKDLEFLYKVYADTRAEEMKLTGWSLEQVEEFLRMQFRLQHTQYWNNYKNKAFDVILFNNKRVGRLYVNRTEKDIRIVDIALLSKHRRKGIGSKIMNELIRESEDSGIPLSLHVEHNNPAMGLYERLGFENRGLDGVYIFMEKIPGNPAQ